MHLAWNIPIDCPTEPEQGYVDGTDSTLTRPWRDLEQGVRRYPQYG
jgi:hypothetical protein